MALRLSCLDKVGVEKAKGAVRSANSTVSSEFPEFFVVRENSFPLTEF